MKEKLKELIYDNYEPCAVPPILGLTDIFIIKKGFSKENIEQLVLEGFIEKCREKEEYCGYRMTKETLKRWMGENSWSYRNFVMSE